MTTIEMIFAFTTLLATIFSPIIYNNFIKRKNKKNLDFILTEQYKDFKKTKKELKNFNQYFNKLYRHFKNYNDLPDSFKELEIKPFESCSTPLSKLFFLKILIHYIKINNLDMNTTLEIMHYNIKEKKEKEIYIKKK